MNPGRDLAASTQQRMAIKLPQFRDVPSTMWKDVKFTENANSQQKTMAISRENEAKPAMRMRLVAMRRAAKVLASSDTVPGMSDLPGGTAAAQAQSS